MAVENPRKTLKILKNLKIQKKTKKGHSKKSVVVGMSRKTLIIRKSVNSPENVDNPEKNINIHNKGHLKKTVVGISEKTSIIWKNIDIPKKNVTFEKLGPTSKMMIIMIIIMIRFIIILIIIKSYQKYNVK